MSGEDVKENKPETKAVSGNQTSTTERLVGIDLARGLAVFGMYAAHIGPAPEGRGLEGFFLELTHGRSSALFAMLAGFGLVLIMGRSSPRTGPAGRQAIVRVWIRSIILLALGVVLTANDAPVEVILSFYGLYFLLALPFHRLSARTLVWLAVLSALLGPQLRFGLEGFIYDQTSGEFPSVIDEMVSLLITGSYPALSWLPFVLAGMALARLDLRPSLAQGRLAIAGVLLAVVGYGGSWLALRSAGSALEEVSRSAEGANIMSAWWSDISAHAWWDSPLVLLTAYPHSETTFSILGNLGVAMAVLALCIFVTSRSSLLTGSFLRPIIAVGSMSLTAYMVHVAGMQIFGLEEGMAPSSHMLFVFILAMAAFASLWSLFQSRGPLEWLMGKTANLARLVP